MLADEAQARKRKESPRRAGVSSAALYTLRCNLAAEEKDGGDMSDYRQQQEVEEERMAHNLAALDRIVRAGLPEVAQELAAELGLKDQFNKEKH